MVTDDKKYISLQRFKRFAQNLPWQRMRKKMGLGDTLGALPPECGGTGATSLPGLWSNMNSQTKKVVYGKTISLEEWFTINDIKYGNASYKHFSGLSLLEGNNAWSSLSTVNGASVITVQPGVYSFSLYGSVVITKNPQWTSGSWCPSFKIIMQNGTFTSTTAHSITQSGGIDSSMNNVVSLDIARTSSHGSSAGAMWYEIDSEKLLDSPTTTKSASYNVVYGSTPITFNAAKTFPNSSNLIDYVAGSVAGNLTIKAIIEKIA